MSDSFSVESALDHQLQWHPQNVTDLLVGSSDQGSASCSCGGWSAAALDNRAGQETTKQSHADHELRELRSTVIDLASRLGYAVG